MNTLKELIEIGVEEELKHTATRERKAYLEKKIQELEAEHAELSKKHIPHRDLTPSWVHTIKELIKEEIKKRGS